MGDETNEPLKAGQAASGIVDAALTDGVADGVGREGLLLGEMMKELEYQLQDHQDAQDECPEGNGSQMVEESPAEGLADWTAWILPSQVREVPVGSGGRNYKLADPDRHLAVPEQAKEVKP